MGNWNLKPVLKRRRTKQPKIVFACSAKSSGHRVVLHVLSLHLGQMHLPCWTTWLMHHMSMPRWLCCVMHAVAERMKVLTNWLHNSPKLTVLLTLGRKHWNALQGLWLLFGEPCAHHCMRFTGNNHGIVFENSEEATRHPRQTTSCKL